MLMQLTAAENYSLSEQRACLAGIKRRLVDGVPSEKRAVVLELVSRADLRGDRLDMRVRPGALTSSRPGSDDDGPLEEVLLSVAATTVRAANEVRLVIASTARTEIERQDPALIRLVSKAQMARELLLRSAGVPLDDLVERFGVTRDYFRTLIRLSFLAPDIVEAILAGKQHGALSRQRLARLAELPLDWSGQRQVLAGQG